MINTAHSFPASPKRRKDNNNPMNIKEKMIFHHYKNSNVSLYKNTDNMTQTFKNINKSQQKHLIIT
ncbi:hypothetical protein FVK40_24200 [Escherichia coli]|nr:hypothetical protein [Escherichia coli]EFA4730068.1 hypothetical protein [Escherichia coli]EFA5271311.1 hypothetical protein [Escherichia coli]EFB2530939.1 hypothetical protein [Escherichia coli]EFB2777615.1 hypothetical protein [Escherichia coli]